MAATPSPKPRQNEQDQEDALQGLLDYCSEKSIIISDSIAARRFAGRGLGVYALRPIKRAESLVHVPVRALFTTQIIPDSFLSKNIKKRVSVHCQLAAYLAFGEEDELLKYQRWIATWPKLEEFIESLPVFWHDEFLGDSKLTQNSKPNSQAFKRRRTMTNAVTEDTRKRFTRSPEIDGFWVTMPGQVAGDKQNSCLVSQANKIRACVGMVDRYLPHINIRHPKSHQSYLRFLHMWSCVSTRCFYYLRPGQSPPEDSNEAMALCPFQDLFNHTDAQGCDVRFDRKGYYVTADRDYEEGEEIFLNYGNHSNDVLWIEYGFTMNQNEADEMKIDAVVLRGMDDTKRKTLDTASYLGDYKLGNNGVCYRTVIASYLGILTDEQWQRMINGGLSPETNTAFAMLKQNAKRRIVDWILLLREEAEHNLTVLSKLTNEDELSEVLADGTLPSEPQSQSAGARASLAIRRKDMCVRRWKQIFNMCMSAVREIERECPGSYLSQDTHGRTKATLSQNADQFIAATKDKAR